jgi:hypothetical protein
MVDNIHLLETSELCICVSQKSAVSLLTSIKINKMGHHFIDLYIIVQNGSSHIHSLEFVHIFCTNRFIAT